MTRPARIRSRSVALGAAALIAAGGALAATASAAPPPEEELPSLPLIPTVQPPDLALDLVVGQVCPAPADLAALRASIAASRRGGAPPDVRVRCDGAPSARLRLGVWTVGPERDPISVAHGRDVVSPARDAGLAQLNVINGSLGALRVSASFPQLLEPLVRSAMENRFAGTSKRLDDVVIRPVGDDQVVTTITGHDTASAPDVSFTTTVTDTLSEQDGAFTCATTIRTVADTRTIDTLAVFGPGLLLRNVFLAQAIAIRAGVEDENAKTPDAGPACQLLDNVFVDKVLLPGGQKLVFSYSDAGVVNGALEAQFFPSQVDRQPTAQIEGPSQITLAPRDVRQVIPQFRLRTDDLRLASGSRAAWTSTSGTVLTPTSLGRTRIRITTAGIAPGTSKRISIRVQVRDSDGLTAEAVKTLVVRRSPLPQRQALPRPQTGPAVILD